ncbi:MAG: hypothetical protein PHF67_01355 [Candidatus Nanoarchaeia archaeon]|nr:hypothetical protein [Candidatus Nanoarchaeia archaeon]
MNKKIFGLFFIFLLFGIGFISAECVDSDGLNYYLKGKTTNNLNNENYNDACVYRLESTNAQYYAKVGDTLYDILQSCSGDNCYVAEATCSDDEVIWNQWDVEQCPFGCNDGACLGNTSSPVKCGKLIYFCSENSPYCDRTAPEIDKYIQNSGCVEVTKHIISDFRDLDKDALAIKYNVLAVPSFIFIDENGCWASIGKAGNTKFEDIQNDINNFKCSNVCKPKFKCENGYIPVCKLINGECSCESCPGIPDDMNSCLNNPNNYWDQETNSCHAGFSKDIIKYTCSDNDGGRNYFEGAHTFGFRSYSSSSEPSKDLRIRTGGKDSCYNGILTEHYCDENGFIQTESFTCPNGCGDKDACLKGEQISEKITCKFENTEQEQKCYLAGQFGPEDEGTKFCIANAESGFSCSVTYSAPKGEKTTWKSSCGGYMYTTQDGTDEMIYWTGCKSGESDIGEVNNKGFRYAYWQCYDGYENKAGDGVSCYPSENFAAKAKEDCQNHCYSDGSKCGVNSFAVNVECYSDEISSNEIFSETGVVIKPSEQVLTSESIICKDSCPLDNKCYPFGYRKSGEYCSDNGAFVEQLNSDSTCDNNFECSSNVCVSGKCIDEGFLNKIINWFKKLFG